MSKLKERVQKLEEKIINLEIIGEVYSPSWTWCGYTFKAKENEYYWNEFGVKDIADR
ncbi:hypothetical protein LCGC14_1950470 [marine sediment metagenome]|uniref:Uncharacterized protein n=1 Tax=marine sediment metagenome TaxID=412755 RepID=A0A0F9FHK4_9ZZZZ